VSDLIGAIYDIDHRLYPFSTVSAEQIPAGDSEVNDDEYCQYC